MKKQLLLAALYKLGGGIRKGAASSFYFVNLIQSTSKKAASLLTLPPLIMPDSLVKTCQIR